MQEYFYQLASVLESALEADEFFTSSFSSENSDFTRFNQSRVRQAGHVVQHEISVDLINGQCHAAGGLTISGVPEFDHPRLRELVSTLRDTYSALPEDPYLLYATDVCSTERLGEDELPDLDSAIDSIITAGRERDLVGIYASGGLQRGFANSAGQRNWFSSHTFNLDWSLYHADDKAVKTSYAGFRWEPEVFRRKVDWSSEQLAAIAKPAMTIEPGAHRVFLAPAAVYDLVSLLCWDGFGLKAHRTKQTTLLQMVDGGSRFDPSVSIFENTADGIAPNFQESGFVRPDKVTLIENGEYCECLTSPRSAKEYSVPTNGASGEEAPESLDVSAGNMPMDEALARLDNGIYVGNLWYLNYSDRNACRVTGMTRFATFLVKHGVVKGPLNVMRFDETLYRALGDNLIDLTSEREMILNAETYYRRSVGSGRMPGAMIEDFIFTL